VAFNGLVNTCKEGNWAAKFFGPKKLQFERTNFVSRGKLMMPSLVSASPSPL